MNDYKSLMRLRKKDLIGMLLTERERADNQFDRAERLSDDLRELEDYENDVLVLDVLKDLIEQYKIENDRESWGVSFAREEKDRLLGKILDFDFSA